MVSFKFAALSGARQCRVGARADTSRCLDGIAYALGRICVVTGIMTVRKETNRVARLGSQIAAI